MGDNKIRLVKTISMMLISIILIELFQYQLISANTDTYSEYQLYPLKIVYEQNSTWGISTQSQYTLINVSETTITDWTIEIDLNDGTTISNIWNANDITNYGIDNDPLVNGNVILEPGQSYSFGLIVDGTDSAPVAPFNIRLVEYIEDNDVTTGDNVTTNTPFPTVPTQNDEENSDVFSYAIYAGSTENEFVFNGWKSTITGDIYTGSDFVYQGSELYVDGNIYTRGMFSVYGWSTELQGVEENTSIVEMPDWSQTILDRELLLPLIDEETLMSQDNIMASGFYYSDSEVIISGTSFTGDVVIVAKNDIVYNIDTIEINENCNGRILLYSEEGDIIINGSQININGIMYAPTGCVSINANETTLNGRIVANEFVYNGSILNVYADDSDLELVNEFPDVNIDASNRCVCVGDNAYFTIEISEDNVFEVLYRLNNNPISVSFPEEENSTTFEIDTFLEGEYVLEAYISLPYREYILDSDSITVVQENTETPTVEPTSIPTVTPTENPEITPTITSVVIPTCEPSVIPSQVPTIIPTTNPTPTENPGYWIISEGDPKYGYEELFQEDNWNYGNDTSFNLTNIELCPDTTWSNGYSFYTTTRTFDENLSFDARFTFRIDHDGSSMADGLAFVISPNTVNNNTDGESIGYGRISPSVVIEIDDFSNAGSRYRDELGEGDWVSRESNSHIAVMLNGNSDDHYAYSEWPEIRTNGSIHNVWVLC